MFRKSVLFICFVSFSWSMFSQINLTSPKHIYFSPNGDGVKDDATITFIYNGSEYVNYNFVLKNSSRVKVWEYSGSLESNNSEVVITWDGIKGKKESYNDDSYTGIITVMDNLNVLDEKKIKLTLDNRKPIAEISGDNKILSANYDGVNDSYRVKQSGSKEALWIGEIIDKRNRSIRKFRWKSSKPGTFKWNGFSDYNRIVPDGFYTYKLSSIDKAGNASEPKYIYNIKVDSSTPKVKINMDNSYFSPNDDDVRDELRINIKSEAAHRVVSHECYITNDLTKEQSLISSGSSSLNELVVNGKKKDGTPLGDGFYTISYSAIYENEYRALNSARFNIQRNLDNLLFNIKASELYKLKGNNIGKFKLLHDNPDNLLYDSWNILIKSSNGATLFQDSGREPLNKELYYSFKNIKEKEYTVYIEVRDSNGNEFRYNQRIDLIFDLVKDGDKFYFDLPLVLFEPYSSDLKIEDSDKERLIKLINKYKDYSIVIESHSYDDGNEPEILYELSESRAVSVRKMLEETGIDKDRLKINPLGIIDPILNIKDESTNRCVRFQVLQK